MVKKLWFQIHWLLGVTAGVVLAVMGVTGATLSFEPELLHWLNPDVMTVSPRPEGPLPPHERAFNQMTLHPVSGAVIRHIRYVERPFGAKLVQSIFVLHSGSFLGLPGSLLMMMVSLAMPLFTVTGWMLYVNRRTKKQAALTMTTLVTSTYQNTERQS